MTENPFSLRQSIMTKEKVFAIKKARFSRDTIEVFVDSNLEISVLCFLFNGKNIKIDNKLFDPNQDASVVFDVPKRNVQYRVQCSALNDSSKVFTSTDSVVVSTKTINWTGIVLVFVIVLFLVSLIVFIVIWRKQNSIHAIYELDEAEIVTLLNKSRDQTQNAMNTADGNFDTLVSTERSIRCPKCRCVGDG
ncbi:hypothetical protein BLSTO_04946 [Blastocystis sp. subtype 1]